MEFLPVKRALLSVTDKSGLVELASFLDKGAVELVSTGGTRKKLLETGLAVKSVSEVTGFPEILGGRVKTLHPRIHAGVLADKDNEEHLQILGDMEIELFDLICVNLYEFGKVAEKNAPLKQAVEEIDIGGPTLLRAGAKNFHSVLVLPDPGYYPRLQQELSENNFCVSLDFRKEMAVRTFTLTCEYDELIFKYLTLCP